MSSEIFPLVIQESDGTVIACSSTNRKAVAKSVERDELWFVHPETERVLPWAGGGVTFSTLTQSPESGGDAVLGYVARLTTSIGEAVTDGTAIDTHDRPDGETDGGDTGAVIAHLIDTIAERRASMPEGSYTTHLFSKGPDKIRKKTGEEAVELILARSSQEMVSEAADLIYHLLVLFEAEGESFSRVIEELRKRF